MHVPQANWSSRTLHCPQYSNEYYLIPLFTGLLPRASPIPVVWWPLRTLWPLPSCRWALCSVPLKTDLNYGVPTALACHPEWATYSLPRMAAAGHTHMLVQCPIAVLRPQSLRASHAPSSLSTGVAELCEVTKNLHLMCTARPVNKR